MHRAQPLLTPRRLTAAHRRARALSAAFAAFGALALTSALAQPAPPPTGIYTCTDDHGRRLTSDRPIPECRAKEQRILNRDGSLKALLPPTLTAEERARKDARDRREAELRAAQLDAIRRDRNLLARFPDETAHTRARETALDPVRMAIRGSALRMNALEAERKPLLSETEFYVGKSLPPNLQTQLDANEAAMLAQQSAMQTQEAELARINRMYDSELERLRLLWAGAAPGSLPSVAAVGVSAEPKP